MMLFEKLIDEACLNEWSKSFSTVKYHKVLWVLIKRMNVLYFSLQLSADEKCNPGN